MEQTSIFHRWLNRQPIGLTSLFLTLVGLGYLIHGGQALFTRAGDYRMWWIEERYVFRGENPADISERLQAESHHQPDPNPGRVSTVDPDLGPTDGSYPLSSYFTSALFTWPSTFEVGRCYNGLVNLALLAGLLFWAWRLGRAEDRCLGWFFAASLLAVNSISTTLIVGQYGVIVLAALVAAYYFDGKDYWLAGGLCLGIAMIKLSLAAPFALPFLMRARWRLLLATGGYLVLGSLVMWPLIKTSPLEIFAQMTVSAEHFEKFGYSLNNVLERLGFGAQAAMRWAAVVSLLSATVLLWLWRSSSLLTHYAIAALASRAWCYHRQYDNLVLAFLLLALAVTVWRTRNPVAILTYLLLGLSLWTPGRLTDIPAWMVLQWTLWIWALVVLLALEERKPGWPLAVSTIRQTGRSHTGR